MDEPIGVTGPSCPRCPSVLTGEGSRLVCDTHGPVPSLWRSASRDYSGFAGVVRRAGTFPAYLPWPLPPGWEVADVGVVEDERPVATVVTVHGSTGPDGDVELTLVTEEAGIGLGSRCAVTDAIEPAAASSGQPSIKVRIDGRSSPLWLLPASDEVDLFAQSSFVGEAEGRWLWMTVRPASAAFLFRDDWLLTDATGLGPEAVEIPFSARPPGW